MTPSEPPPTLGGKTLPPELLFHVIAYLADEVATGDTTSASRTLTAIARCSKSHNKPAVRALYRRIRLDEHNFRMFFAEQRRYLLQYTECLVVDGLPSREDVLEYVPVDPNPDAAAAVPAPYLVLVWRDDMTQEPYVPAPPLGRVLPNVTTVTFTERAVRQFGQRESRDAWVTFEEGESDGCPPPAHMFEEALATLVPQHVCASLLPPRNIANWKRHRAQLLPGDPPATAYSFEESSNPEWLLRLTNRWHPQSVTVHNCPLGGALPDVDTQLLRIWPTDTLCNADGEHDSRICEPSQHIVPAIGQLFVGPQPDPFDDPDFPPLYRPLTERKHSKRVEIPAIQPPHFRFGPCAAVEAWASGVPHAATVMAALGRTLDVPAIEDVSPCPCCGARVVDGRGIKPSCEADS